MLKNLLLTILCFIMPVFPVLASADDKAPNGTILNISATEYTQITQDLIIANMHYESEAQNAKEVQTAINNIMSKVLEKSKRFSNAQLSTSQYSVYKYDYQDKKQNTLLSKWKGSQSLSITGRDSESIIKLVGELQDLGLAVDSLNYTISDEKRDETRDTLMEKAVSKLLAKATRVAKSLGKTETKVININVDADNTAPIPFYQTTMRVGFSAKSEMPPPIVEPGQSTITMTVSATILIKD